MLLCFLLRFTSNPAPSCLIHSLSFFSFPILPSVWALLFVVEFEYLFFLVACIEFTRAGFCICSAGTRKSHQLLILVGDANFCFWKFSTASNFQHLYSLLLHRYLFPFEAGDFVLGAYPFDFLMYLNEITKFFVSLFRQPSTLFVEENNCDLSGINYILKLFFLYVVSFKSNNI